METPNPHDEPAIEDRLRAIGETPIDDATRSAHLRRAGAARPADGIVPVPRRRFGPLAVGAAAVLGFVAGSTGLAMAGALPDTAQGVAHDVLGVVQLDVPEGREGKRGPCVAEAAKLEDEEAKQAAKDACPKGNPHDDDTDDDTDDAPGRSGDAPGRSGDAPGRSGEAPGKSGDAPGRSGDKVTGADRHADDPCRGRPPWAGPMSQEEREALRDEFSRDDCDTDDPDEVDEPDDG